MDFFSLLVLFSAVFNKIIVSSEQEKENLCPYYETYTYKMYIFFGICGGGRWRRVLGLSRCKRKFEIHRDIAIESLKENYGSLQLNVLVMYSPGLFCPTMWLFSEPCFHMSR